MSPAGGSSSSPAPSFSASAGKAIGNGATQLVPGAAEAEVSLLAGAHYANMAGFSNASAGLTTLAEAVPVVAAGGIVGAVGGNVTEYAAQKAGLSKDNSFKAGVIGAMVSGGAVGALVGAPTGIGAPVGFVVGAAMGLGAYLWSR